ncbi:LrgB family protein [Meridianimarinicoccus sp. MJW13]|uniref:LrgB family protein n=1 Tax=Meridianimarinicoccus sp. MJW13 TaxID=2720031 RepID=UPI00186771DF|nr:LrgB family protein [Fluviibacterium sp. MJW13]
MPVTDIWIYLLEGPLVWLTLTILAYLVGDALFKASGGKTTVNPVLIAIILLSGLLLATDTPYGTYFVGAQFVHFLLGPATVSLALPLYWNRHLILRTALPMVAALLAGSLVSMLTALGVGWLLGLQGVSLLSLGPKAATSPIAIGVAEKIGAAPSLTAALVILTGILGAVIVTPLFNALGVKDYRARGFATGVSASGIGTARALQVHPTAGAFAGIGMGMNAVFTALAAPYIIGWLFA